jgi:RNA 2',3'-cyclic 3'-phosphodiesterase
MVKPDGHAAPVMHRLFVALVPPAAIRARLIGLMAGVPGARWQDDEQLHVTLRYIGEVDRPMAEDVALALGQLHAPAPEAALAGVGQFDDRGRTNAIWAGLAPQEGLAALHRKVDQALVRIGLDPEGRAYLPHITLARFARSAGGSIDIERFLGAHAGLSSERFVMPWLTLFESHLGGEGARYEPVERYRLG